MKFSSSKLSCILNNPKDYYLKYVLGINPIEKKDCFSIGSAVHWGLENNTEDLTQWFKENGSISQKISYSLEQEQAEAMVHGFFIQKEKIMNEVFKDYDTGERLSLNEEGEFHELELYSKIPSNITDNHEFMGIIDLLYLTEKGFILMDYKTSSTRPDFTKYLDQIYRYIFLLEDNFPDIPIYKIGIINIIKSRIKKIRAESDTDFRNRWKRLYEDENSDLINVHMYNVNMLDRKKIDSYKKNLTMMCDMAYLIDEYGTFYLDAKHANGENGSYRSVYIDIYNDTADWWLDFTIKDKMWAYDEETDQWEMQDKRNCIALDKIVIGNESELSVLYQYSQYKSFRDFYKDYDKTIDYIKKNYTYYDEELLNRYEETYKHDVSEGKEI